MPDRYKDAAIPRSVPRYMNTPSDSARTTMTAQNTVWQNKGEGGRYFLSPRRTMSNPVPRAWERRPATPFAPRSESHKIWKRCLLQQLGREQQAGRGNEEWRSVKRLRVTKDSGFGGRKSFVGTTFTGLEDVERARERKIVNDELCEALRSLKDEEGKIAGEGCGGVNAQKGSELGQLQSSERGVDDRRRQARDDSTADPSTTQVDLLNGAAGAFQIGSGYDGILKTESRIKGAAASPIKHSSEMNQDRGRQRRANTLKPMPLGYCGEPVHSPSPDVAQEICQGANVAEKDDTEYLHAFLTRAKAKKAAQAMLSPPQEITLVASSEPTQSPPTWPLTALTTIDRNSPPSQKVKRREVREREVKSRRVDPATVADREATSSSPRKSSRLRQNPVQQNQTGPPNTIPFRRANGTEFIFLEKTEAQQMAIATRSNTKKNKGDALQPKMKLQALSAPGVASPAPVLRRKRSNFKRVSWDDDLTYFAREPLLITEDAALRADGQAPVRRSRRPTSGRGTPAPKRKMAEAAKEAASSTAASTAAAAFTLRPRTRERSERIR